MPRSDQSGTFGFQLAPVKSITLVEVQGLKLPIMVSPKLDGIRLATHFYYGPITRSFKSIPNRYVHRKLTGLLNAINELEGLWALDGELIYGSPVPVDGDTVFHRTQSAVMSIEGEPEFTYYLFDALCEGNFEQRLARLYEDGEKLQINHPFITVLPQVLCTTYDEVLEAVNECITQGYEGGMLRNPYVSYRQRRCTFKDNIIHKFKEWDEDSAEIIGVQEMMHNTNPVDNTKTRNKRSKVSSGLVPSGMAGSLLCKNKAYKEPFGVSLGSVDHASKQYVWENRDGVVGTHIVFKYQPYGTVDAPRGAVFVSYK